jgi:hypothetical protein
VRKVNTGVGKGQSGDKLEDDAQHIAFFQLFPSCLCVALVSVNSSGNRLHERLNQSMQSRMNVCEDQHPDRGRKSCVVNAGDQACSFEIGDPASAQSLG